MSMDWLKIRCSLATDPRVLTIAAEVDRPVCAVVGALVILWSAASTHSTEGTLPRATPRSVDLMVGIDGFAAALVSVDWLRFTTDGEPGHPGAIIPRWGEHNSDTARKRAEHAAQTARARAQKSNENQHASRTNKAAETHDERTPVRENAHTERTRRAHSGRQEQEQEQEGKTENPPVAAGAATSPRSASPSREGVLSAGGGADSGRTNQASGDKHLHRKSGECSALLGGPTPMLSGPSGLDDNTSGDSGLRGDQSGSSANPVYTSKVGSDADAKRAYVDAIYAAYPVKRLPEKARQAIGNAIKREAMNRKVRWSEAAEHILARTKAYAASEYVRSRMAAGHTVKHPKPWFDGGGYDEPDEEWARTWRVDGQRDGPTGTGTQDAPEPAWKTQKRDAKRAVRQAVG